jgi:hypothetical protein
MFIAMGEGMPDAKPEQHGFASQLFLAPDV